jgi:hypothetical protein
MSLSPVDRAGFEAIATVCGIGLGPTCYCRAYRDGVARGEPGGPSVGGGRIGREAAGRQGEMASHG